MSSQHPAPSDLANVTRVSPASRSKCDAAALTQIADPSDEIDETVLQPETMSVTRLLTPEDVLAEQASSPEPKPAKDLKGARPPRFGRFFLLELLGRGGMGEVYRAVHARLRKQVALKLLSPGRADDPQARERFAREVRLMCGLAHPNLVRLETAGEHDGLPYLVMEYVPGVDLQLLVHRVGPLPVPDACQLIGQATLGLSHLHEHGLIHRDIKPSNLIVTPTGALKVADLGIARQAVLHPEDLTAEGHIAGDAHYMPPEQIDPEQTSDSPDIRGDIYSLGCTMFALLSGHPPFHDAGPDVADILAAHLRQPFPDIADERTDLPLGLVEVLAKMTARRPADRYATPMQVVAALAPFAVGCDVPRLMSHADLTPLVTARSDSPSIDTAEYLVLQAEQSAEFERPDIDTSRRQRRRRRTVAATICACAILAGVAGWFTWPKEWSEPSVADPASTSAAVTGSAMLAGKQQQSATTKAGAAKSGSAEDSWDLPAPTPNHSAPALEDDLLQHFDPDRDVFDLDVEVADEALVIGNLNGRGILQIPVIAPEEYELELAVERLAGEGSFGIGFSAAGGRLLAILDHTREDRLQSGLMHVLGNGRRHIDSPHEGAVLPADQPVRVQLRTGPRRAELLFSAADTDAGPAGESVEVAWQTIARWPPAESGPIEALVHSFFAPDDASEEPRLGPYDSYYPGALFLHVYNGTFRIRQMRLLASNTPPVAQPFLGPDATRERSLAEQIVWRGGHVEVITDGGTDTVHRFDQLTNEPWLLGVAKCPSAPRLAIGDQQLLELSQVRDLKVLDLRGSDVTAAGLASLAGLTGLQALALPDGSLDGSALSTLRDLPALRTLKLLNVDVTDTDLAPLQRFPGLVSLCLSGTQVSDAGVEQIAVMLPNLEHLCLNGAPIEGTCLNSLQKLRHLKDLELNGTRVTDERLPLVAGFPALKTLHLQRTGVTETAILALQDQRPQIEVKH